MGSYKNIMALLHKQFGPDRRTYTSVCLCVSRTVFMFSRVLSALFRPQGKPDLNLEFLRESYWGVSLGYMSLPTGTKVWPGARGVEEV